MINFVSCCLLSNKIIFNNIVLKNIQPYVYINSILYVE